MGGKSAPRVACGANYPSQERAISPAARTTLFTRVVQFCPRTGGRVEVEGERAAICRAIEAESRREGEGGEEEERKIEDSERRSQQQRNFQQQKAAHIAGIYVIYTPKKATGAGSEQQAARRKAQGASARPCASARQPKRSKAPKRPKTKAKAKAKANIQEQKAKSKKQKAKSKRSWLIY
jgi:hypothetical protein